MTPLFTEHSIPGEVRLDTGWVPGWVFFRPGTGYLRVEAWPEDRPPQVWESLNAYAFEDIAELLQELGCGVEDIPLWRTRVTLAFEAEGVRMLRPATLTINYIRRYERFQNGEVRWVNYDRYHLHLDGEAAPRMVNDLLIDGGVVRVGRKIEDLLTLVQEVPGLCCCGTCAYGECHTLGGTDFAFGLHCFRDNPNGMELKYYSLEEWDAVAHRNTPALHLCPAYRRRDHRI
ncbi:hypothetical protein BH11ARM2_BH11ARM2_24530 [soil metagenome]